MTAYVSLLRAVNLAGNNRVAMADLRRLYESLGFGGVATYVNSGNVVFSARATDVPRLPNRIERAIAARFGAPIDVITRTAGDLRDAIAANPFPTEAAADPTKVVVVFLPASPAKAERDALAKPVAGPERLKLVGADLYVHYPDGQGRSKLKLPLKAPGTARNWNTVVKLAEMAAALEGG